MRDVIRAALGEAHSSHFGHAYDVLGPKLTSDGKPDTEDRERWLKRCEQIEISPDYGLAYRRWKDSFSVDEATLREVEASSRLLIGHGNPSGSDVGLTVHRSWGVPLLPGSALKGMLAHYVDAVYGDPNPSQRRAWLGPTWRNGRVARDDAAGDAYARLFGAPAVDGNEHSACRGLVEFHDALYVPGSAPNNHPFARDVLTVHQKPYYDHKGEDGRWPNDWTSPVPVGFMTVRPKTKFLLVVIGPQQWRSLAMTLLFEALNEWGIGGKTSAGYGRLQTRASTR
jgi:CRISPR-associated protein Cmr6